MIVKNEMAVLKKCFDSIVEHLDYWVICDTGSTDGSQEFIKNYFKEKGIPGELHEEEWVNFGHNRSSYFKHAQNKSDFLLVLDADEVVNVHDKNFKNNLKGKNTHYLVKYDGNLDYRYGLLFSGNILWKSVGVTHEYVTSDEEYQRKRFDDITINHIGNGANKSNKFERDIDLLTEGIKNEPRNARYYFYLANSYYNIGKYEDAIKWYEDRVRLGGWEEEVYYSLYRIGLSKQKLRHTFEEETLYSFLKAYNYRKTRLEALYEIVRYYRVNKMWKEGYSYGLLGFENEYPLDILFIDKDIHQYKLLDELSICAYWVKDFDLSIQICERILKLYGDSLGFAVKTRIMKNLQWSLLEKQNKKEKYGKS